MAYEGFKDLTRSAASDKILHDKVFNVAKIQNMMDINVALSQWSIIFMIKKLLVEQSKIKLRLIKT